MGPALHTGTDRRWPPVPTRRGHSELGVEAINKRVRVDAAFDELAQAIGHHGHNVIVRSAPSPNATAPVQVPPARRLPKNQPDWGPLSTIEDGARQIGAVGVDGVNAE